MHFLKELWHFIIAVICTPVMLVVSLFVRHRSTTSRDVRIIHCLSSNTPNVGHGKIFPSHYIGVISSDFPKKCMIPETETSFITKSDLCNPNFPKLVTLSGFEKTLFYPFRELAQALGYDVLWCTYREPDSMYYTGHVLFAEHVQNGLWICLNEEYTQMFFGDFYHGALYTGGWQYACPTEHSEYYVVQSVDETIYIPWKHVIKVVEST